MSLTTFGGAAASTCRDAWACLNAWVARSETPAAAVYCSHLLANPENVSGAKRRERLVENNCRRSFGRGVNCRIGGDSRGPRR